MRNTNLRVVGAGVVLGIVGSWFTPFILEVPAAIGIIGAMLYERKTTQTALDI